MRISLDRTDSGYNPESHLYKVYVDGVHLEHCITIDTDLKIAVVYSTNEAGLVFIGDDFCLAKETWDLSNNKIKLIKIIDVVQGLPYPCPVCNKINIICNKDCIHIKH